MSTNSGALCPMQDKRRWWWQTDRQTDGYRYCL